jgi:hypothetical protein
MHCPLETPNGPDLILAYVSQGLEAETSALFEKHMADCHSCREFARDQQSVWSALDLFEAAPISDGFNRRLYQRIEQPVGVWDRLVKYPIQEMLQSFQRPLGVRQALPLAAAASLLLVAAAMWQQHVSPQPTRPVALLQAQIEALRPDQVESALDDMEMVSEFSQRPTAESPDAKM